MALFDFIKLRIEFKFSLHHGVDVGTGQRVLGSRQPLIVGLLARLEHVGEHIDAALPLLEVVIEVVQVPIILQTFLEFMRCQHVVQVAGLGPLRQLLQPPEPARAIERIVGEKLVEDVAGLDEADRTVDAIGFLVKCLDRVEIVIRCLAY